MKLGTDYLNVEASNMKSNIQIESKDIAKTHKNKYWRAFGHQRYLLAMLLPFLIWGFIFLYMPLYGWIMAFMRYSPGKPLFSNQWVGVEHFRVFLFESGEFWIVMRNSIVLSMLGLIFQLPLAVLLAIIIYELPFRIFKRTVQTISYLPHFVSWVIVANLFFEIFSRQGVLNNLLLMLGIVREPIFFLGEPGLTWPILTATRVWKGVGWDSIIFLGAISGIDPNLYEAAYVDGCNKFQRIRHITLPGIMPTVSVIIILSAGAILNTGFEQYYLFGTPANRLYSDVLDTYVYRYGLAMGQFSFATAVGMFKTILSLIVLFTVNAIFKRTNDKSIF